MRDIQLLQLVHGYDHGHSLLAASTKLDPRDLHLTARLSDLSGSLVSGSNISPYLTFYPLPSERFYVVAATWPDESAPRAGCVLTHSLLVPTSEWASVPDPSSILIHLRKPERTTLTEYEQPLTWSTSANPGRHSEPLGKVFVQRYFGEGLVPLAWFGAEDPDSAALSVIKSLWPSLRSRFACCTNALQPRTLGVRPFDLHFANTQSYSRFSEFSREHVIDSRHNELSNADESWVEILTDYVFPGNEGRQFEEIRTLSSDLDPYPALIRKVILFLSLRNRIDVSPTAALGALDILLELAPTPGSAAKEKSSIVETALASIDVRGSSNALEQLYLLSQRMEEPSIDSDRHLQGKAENLVHEVVAGNPRSSLLTAIELFQRRPSAASPAFLAGIGAGLTQVLPSSPEAVDLLLQQDVFGSRLLESNPALGSAVLDAAARDSRGLSVSAISKWCRAIDNPLALTELRNTLLPRITEAADVSLVEVLLQHVDEDDVGFICRVVDENDAFRTQAILAVLIGVIGEQHPQALRHWCEHNQWSSYQVSALLTVSLELSHKGLSDLFALPNASGSGRAHMLAAFILRASEYSVPKWLSTDLAGVDARIIWELLLEAMPTSEVQECLGRLMRDVRRSSIARSSNILSRLEAARGTFGSSLRKYAFQQLFADFLEGDGEDEHMEYWLSQRWAPEMLSSLPSGSLIHFVTTQAGADPRSWWRTWVFMKSASKLVGIESGGVVQDVLTALINVPSKRWDADVEDIWTGLLRNYAKDVHRYNAMCQQALTFALNHTYLTIGKVVAESFYSAHDAAMSDRGGSLLGWYFADWDKGKELRRSLVDAFTHCSWSPEYFVLAAREPWLLRKLYRRMRRQWSGEKFLHDAYAGLKASNEPGAGALRGALAEMIGASSIFEDWD